MFLLLWYIALVSTAIPFALAFGRLSLGRIKPNQFRDILHLSVFLVFLEIPAMPRQKLLKILYIIATIHRKLWIEHMIMLEKFLKICNTDNFNPYADIRDLIRKRAKCSGRKMTAECITLYCQRIEVLLNMRRSETDSDLQHFIFVVNWMRNDIPEYSVTKKLFKHF